VSTAREGHHDVRSTHSSVNGKLVLFIAMAILLKDICVMVSVSPAKGDTCHASHGTVLVNRNIINLLATSSLRILEARSSSSSSETL